MTVSKNIKLLPLAILLISVLISPMIVSASEGSKFRQCTDMADEAQKNTCIAQLETEAAEACKDESDRQTCIDNFKFGSEKVVDAETRRARNTCQTWNDCPLMSRYVTPAINALSGAVGIVVVTMIVWGGIRYTSSRDNPQQAASAKEHIRNALFALVIYIFMMAFLNWVVPGGVFNA